MSVGLLGGSRIPDKGELKLACVKMLLFNIHLFIKITRLSAESSASEPKQAQNRVVRATLHSACRQSTAASANPPLNVLLLKSRRKKHTNRYQPKVMLYQKF